MAKTIFKPNPGEFSDAEVLGIDGDGEFIPVQNWDPIPLPLHHCPICGGLLDSSYLTKSVNESKEKL